MKDWKMFLIGFLLAAVLFLFTGASSIKQTGTYQIALGDSEYAVINTKTGEYVVRGFSWNEWVEYKDVHEGQFTK